MKYIFCLIFLFLWGLNTFANENVNISLSADKISLSESFLYRVEIYDSSVTADGLSFDIPWIENFSLFSQSSSSDILNINGETTSRFLYIFSLRPETVGSFSLWPIKILSSQGDIQDDEIVNIQVEDDRPPVYIQENISPTESDTSIRPLREVSFSRWGIIGLVVLFFILFYIVLLYATKTRKTQTLTSIPTQEKSLSQREKVIQYFEFLGWEIWELSSQRFFQKYNTGIRWILQQEGVKNAHKITLSELKKYSEVQRNEVYKIFQRSYKHEYTQKGTTVETQKKYIDDIVEHLQK